MRNVVATLQQRCGNVLITSESDIVTTSETNVGTPLIFDRVSHNVVATSTTTLSQRCHNVLVSSGYKQVSGVAIGFPLGPTLANAFLVHFEKNWLQNCPSDLKHHYYRRYVNDIFALFISPKHLEAFHNLLNSGHANMSMTIEREKQNWMSFLDIAIISEDKTFTTSVYPKLTFSGVYIHFNGFLLSTYKFGNCK